MSPSRTCSPATIPVGSLSYSQAPTYSAWPSVRIRTSVRSVTGAPSCSSRCTKPVTGVASSHAGSVRRPSTTGGVTTACAVAVGPWRAQSDDSRTVSMECQEAGIERAAQQAPPLPGSSAGALAKGRLAGGETKYEADPNEKPAGAMLTGFSHSFPLGRGGAHAADLTASGPVPAGVCPSFAGCAGGVLLVLNGPSTLRALAQAPISSALSPNR